MEKEPLSDEAIKVILEHYPEHSFIQTKFDHFLFIIKNDEKELTMGTTDIEYYPVGSIFTANDIQIDIFTVTSNDKETMTITAKPIASSIWYKYEYDKATNTIKFINVDGSIIVTNEGEKEYYFPELDEEQEDEIANNWHTGERYCLDCGSYLCGNDKHNRYL